MERNDEEVRALSSFATSLHPQEFPPLAQTEVLSQPRSPSAVRLGCGISARFAL